MGNHKCELIVPFHRKLSYSHLKNREQMQRYKQTPNKPFPVPNRKKAHQPETTQQESAIDD